MKRTSLLCAASAISVAMIVAGLPALTYAQDPKTPDHLKCYKIKDPLKLKGIVDIESVQFGLEPGCKIRKAKLFCVPATKTVREAFNKKEPIVPLPIDAQPAPGDRICYKVKCEKQDTLNVEVSDQFANRVIERKDAFMLCTPAIKGSPFECGNGLIDPNEQCDPPQDAACPGLCLTDCRCGIEIDPFPNTVGTMVVTMPDASEFTVEVSGPTTVEVDLGTLGDPNGSGREQVQTEIVSMTLTGEDPQLGTVVVRAGKDLGVRASTGLLIEQTNDTPGVLDVPPFVAGPYYVDSFFDVFFEIEIEIAPGVILHNQDPKRMGAVISNKPPAEGETYTNSVQTELYDEDGNPTGISVGNASHTPNPDKCEDTYPVCGGVCLEPNERCHDVQGVCQCVVP